MSSQSTLSHLAVLGDVLEQRGHVQQLDHGGSQVCLVSALRVEPRGVERQAAAQQPLAVLQVDARRRQLVQQDAVVLLVVDREHL